MQPRRLSIGFDATRTRLALTLWSSSSNMPVKGLWDTPKRPTRLTADGSGFLRLVLLWASLGSLYGVVFVFIFKSWIIMLLCHSPYTYPPMSLHASGRWGLRPVPWLTPRPRLTHPRLPSLPSTTLALSSSTSSCSHGKSGIRPWGSSSTDGFLWAVAAVFLGWKTSFVATSGLALHPWWYSVRVDSFCKFDTALPLGRFPLAWSLLWVSPA